MVNLTLDDWGRISSSDSLNRGADTRCMGGPMHLQPRMPRLPGVNRVPPNGPWHGIVPQKPGLPGRPAGAEWLLDWFCVGAHPCSPGASPLPTVLPLRRGRDAGAGTDARFARPLGAIGPHAPIRSRARGRQRRDARESWATQGHRSRSRVRQSWDGLRPSVRVEQARNCAYGRVAGQKGSWNQGLTSADRDDEVTLAAYSTLFQVGSSAGDPRARGGNECRGASRPERRPAGAFHPVCACGHPLGGPIRASCLAGLRRRFQHGFRLRGVQP